METLGKLYQRIGRIEQKKRQMEQIDLMIREVIKQKNNIELKNEKLKETVRNLEEDLKIYTLFNNDNEEDLEQGKPETEEEIVQRYEQRITRIIEQYRIEI